LREEAALRSEPRPIRVKILPHLMTVTVPGAAGRLKRMIFFARMAAVLRSITSVSLAIWMAMLACLVGCGQMFAKSHANADFSGAGQVSAEMPVCHHSSVPSKQKKQQRSSISCCLPDAISQKSTPTAIQVCVTESPVPGAGFPVADATPSLTAAPLHVRLHRGRDTLLQTRLLRI
jgi:hypothetical protein